MPQLVVLKQVIAAEPAVIPVTTPVALLTVAMAALLLLQLTPLAVEVKVMAAPSHTVVGPLIVPADAAGSTVMVYVAMPVPQLPLTT